MRKNRCHSQMLRLCIHALPYAHVKDVFASGRFGAPNGGGDSSRIFYLLRKVFRSHQEVFLPLSRPILGVVRLRLYSHTAPQLCPLIVVLLVFLKCPRIAQTRVPIARMEDLLHQPCTSHLSVRLVAMSIEQEANQ